MGICQTLNHSVPSLAKTPEVNAASVAIVVWPTLIGSGDDPSRFAMMNHNPSENAGLGRVQLSDGPSKLTTRGLEELSVWLVT
jgi:hypothetical protein